MQDICRERDFVNFLSDLFWCLLRNVAFEKKILTMKELYQMELFLTHELCLYNDLKRITTTRFPNRYSRNELCDTAMKYYKFMIRVNWKNIEKRLITFKDVLLYFNNNPNLVYL